MFSEKQVQKFMQSLYENGDNELKKLFKHQYDMKSTILGEVANIMLIYVVENDVMIMSEIQQKREMKKLGNLINSYMKADAEMQISIIYNLLSGTVDNTFKFYSYNSKKKDIKTIIDKQYEGKHFSKRVWENEEEVAKYIHKQLEEFLNGKVSVNKIKKNVDGLFNSGAYNAKRLAETEISRCASEAFNKFGDEVGIKKVRYNAQLEACDKCKPFDGKLYDFDNKPELPKHPFCRCYYDIVE